MKRGLIVLAVVLFLGCWLTAVSAGPEESLKLTGPYVGQKPPGLKAIRFAPGIVSTEHHEHSRIEFGKDGKELYWAVIPVEWGNTSGVGISYKMEEQKIWVTRLQADGWTVPQAMAVSPGAAFRSPTLSAGGDIFYFKTANPEVPQTRPPVEVVWECSRSNGEWRKPKLNTRFPLKKDGKFNMSFCFSKNGNLYFDLGETDESGRTKISIYASKFKNNDYSEPELLGQGINEGEANWTPWIAPDESYLIFSSHRQGHLGSGDLYISYRDRDGRWSDPINMGTEINTPSQERFPSVSPDGKYLFFARLNRETYSDFYWIDAAIIKKLRKKVDK